MSHVSLFVYPIKGHCIFGLVVGTFKKIYKIMRMLRPLCVCSDLYAYAEHKQTVLKGTQDCEFFGSELEFCTISLLVVLKY
jgi:hypothetical protein